VIISVDDNLLINTLQAEEELNQLKQFQTVEKTGYTIRMRVLTNMTPADAVISIRQVGDALECTKLLYLMQAPERKTIISELNNGSDKDKRLAADILKRIEHIKNAIPQNNTNNSTGKQTAK